MSDEQGSDAADGGTRASLGSDELCEVQCESCANVKVATPARGFCVDCGEYFCATCCDNHRKFNITRDHVIKPADDMPKNRSSGTSQGRTVYMFVDKCFQHDDLIKFFCQKCDEVGCSVCMTTGHRECGRVEFIPDITDKQTLSEETTNVMNQFDQTLDELESERRELDTNKERMPKYKHAYQVNIAKEREAINTKFDDLQQIAISQANSVSDLDSDKLKSVERDLASCEEDIRCRHMRLQDTKAIESPIQNFIAVKEGKRCLKTTVTALEKIRKSNKVRRYTFVSTPEVKELLQHVASLGSLQFSTRQARTAIFDRQIPVCSEEEESKGGTIQGMEMLSENRLFVTDSYNYSIKVVSLCENRVISSHKMVGWPFAVTTIRTDQLAVTLPYQGFIQFLTIDKASNITLGKVLDRCKTCCGIQYAKGQLYVTYTHPKVKLEIIDLSGRVLKSFSKGLNDLPLFDRPFYLTTNVSNDELFVADIQRNTITRLTLNGDIISVVRYKENLKDIRGITTDSDGLVYACALTSQTVCYLAGKEMKYRALLDRSHGIVLPLSIYYCKREDLLYVGGEKGTHIQTFRIS